MFFFFILFIRFRKNFSEIVSLYISCIKRLMRYNMYICFICICRHQWRHSPALAQTRRPPPPKDRLMDRRFCTIATPSVTLMAVMAKVPHSVLAVETLSSTSKRLIYSYFMFLNSCIIVMYKIIIWLFYIM